MNYTDDDDVGGGITEEAVNCVNGSRTASAIDNLNDKKCTAYVYNGLVHFLKYIYIRFKAHIPHFENVTFV